MDLLRQFHENVALREQVKAFFIANLEQQALAKLRKGEDASHLADAMKAVEQGFTMLRNEYEPKPKPTLTSTR